LAESKIGGVGSWRSRKLAESEVGGGGNWRSRKLAEAEVGGVGSWWSRKLAESEIGRLEIWWVGCGLEWRVVNIRGELSVGQRDGRLKIQHFLKFTNLGNGAGSLLGFPHQKYSLHLCTSSQQLFTIPSRPPPKKL